ncbi:MAG: ATP-binding protein [Candidatus Cyclobacteriaceae bacterium M3_2C_046]
MSGSYISEEALLKEIKYLKQKIAEYDAGSFSNENEARYGLSKYEKIINASGAALWLWDLELNELYLSESGRQLLGYEKSDHLPVYSKFWLDQVHPQDLEKVRSVLETCRAGKLEQIGFPVSLKNKDGQYVASYIKLGSVKNDGGQINKIAGITIDISSEQPDQHQTYRNWFDQAMVGCFTVDIHNGSILDSNPKTWEVLKLPPQKNIRNVLKYLDFEVFKEKLEILKLTGILEKEEILFEWEKGGERWLNYYVRLDQLKQTAQITLTDITKEKLQLIELQKTNSELDNFVYHSSHDLRSPLRSMLGLINIIRQEKDPRAQQECIDMIEGSILRLDKLVNDLLNISRNNRIDDKYQPVNLMIELNNSITNFYHTSNTNKLEIISKVSQPIPFVSDLTRIRIILNNLISNAIKYRSFSKNNSYVKIDILVDQQQAILIFEDNGIGIPKSMTNKVFEMFFRASENGEGSGLGLYIVKSVIDKMNGTIRLDSEEKKGSKFTICLPNHWDGNWNIKVQD